MTTPNENSRADALTDEQILDLAGRMSIISQNYYKFGDAYMIAFARAIRALPPVDQPVAAAIDRRHIGDSKFEGWYSNYDVKGEINRKQIARDAYAAGMGDMTPQPAPAPAPIESAELASMTRMFHAACHDLGLINEALGLDPDDGGAAPILDAIAELKRERDQWVDANYAAPSPADERAAFDYDAVVSICDAHGICLPVGCVEMVVEIVKLSGLLNAQPATTGEHHGE